jgi:sec-independent protein translocase protein TatB
MIDLGISKMALIGAVALIVIGPEKLPRVARTVGTLLGKAQRYVNDVKAEVNRSMELDELRKMKDQRRDRGARRRELGAHRRQRVREDVVRRDQRTGSAAARRAATVHSRIQEPEEEVAPEAGATPQWYKARAGVRTRALSGAARVARYRPHSINKIT